MKKAFSLLLLAAFLFNLGGYYLLFWVLEARTDAHLSARLDIDHYYEHETFEVKLPLTLPYPINAESFQRLDGKFEHNGEFYKLVKHRLVNDTLFVVLIKNQELRKLTKAFHEFAVQSHQPTASSGKDTFQVFKLLTEFDREGSLGLERTKRWCVTCLCFLPLAPLSDPVIERLPDPPDFVG